MNEDESAILTAGLTEELNCWRENRDSGVERSEFLIAEAFGGLNKELWVNMSEIQNVKLRGILKEDASGILSRGASGSVDDFLSVEARGPLSGDISDILNREMDEALNGDVGCLQNGVARAIPSRDVCEPYSNFHPCFLWFQSPLVPSQALPVLPFYKSLLSLATHSLGWQNIPMSSSVYPSFHSM